VCVCVWGGGQWGVGKGGEGGQKAHAPIRNHSRLMKSVGLQRRALLIFQNARYTGTLFNIHRVMYKRQQTMTGCSGP
jgi:hypothetical protein